VRETNHCGAELALHQPFFLPPDDKRADIIFGINKAFIPRPQCVRHRTRVQTAKIAPQCDLFFPQMNVWTLARGCGERIVQMLRIS
jgi:hypothetical protein